MQATGSNSQAAAAPITTPSAVVVTVSASSRGVRLPAARAGLTELLNNAGANPVQVFPAAGDRPRRRHDRRDPRALRVGPFLEISQGHARLLDRMVGNWQTFVFADATYCRALSRA
jgi:hypothetical protein